jgi:hypothetical protein
LIDFKINSSISQSGTDLKASNQDIDCFFLIAVRIFRFNFGIGQGNLITLVQAKLMVQSMLNLFFLLLPMKFQYRKF